MMTRALPRAFACCAAIAIVACHDNGPDVSPATVAIGPTSSAITIASGVSMNLTATVKNAGGEPLAGQIVTWMSSDPSVVAVTPAGAITGAKAGEADVVANVGSVSSPALSVTVTPGAVARLTIRTQPAGAASGAAFTTQPVVEIRDAAGNLVTSSTTVVTATIATGGGTIIGSTAAATDGVATFASLTISGTIGDRTLLFSAPGASSVTSIGVALAPGAPARLVVRTQPSGATVDAPLATQPVVEVRDGAGNLATGSNVTVTAGIGNGGGSVTNATVQAASGLAAFTNLTMSGTPGDRTLTFSAPGVPTISSAAFTLSPGTSVEGMRRR
jgi:hypothetical protein